ncbi:MAG TPA: hypothetical protein VFQ61_18760 [Polyangiaceae bacterium]|nr:hypothetical protein [Polyangiaceae bacterium]
MTPSGTLEPRRCASCNKLSPPTVWGFTLLMPEQGWIVRSAEGSCAVWYCPDCSPPLRRAREHGTSEATPSFAVEQVAV